MLSVNLKSTLSLCDAARTLLQWLGQTNIDFTQNFSVGLDVAHACEQEFFCMGGIGRIYFKSRDSELEWWGLGACESIFQSHVDDESALSQVVKKKSHLNDDLIYFGGIRFDKNRSISSEWHDFRCEFFVLPMLLMKHSAEGFRLSLNYRLGGLPSKVWLDHAQTILMAIMNNKVVLESIDYSFNDYVYPSFDSYKTIIEQALSLLMSNEHYKKVVIGRCTRRTFSKSFDPLHIFLRLKEVPHAFLFMFDNGFGSTFLGATPELLYRRIGQNFETESLAGTRPRSKYEQEDELLRKELFASHKDKSEHFFVSKHIEDRMREFGISDLFTSKLEILSLPFVQHLRRRYHGRIDEKLSDDKIIEALHPTPAVCGLNAHEAKLFIRDNEGFDRGFFASPIGYIAKNSAEFAVAIRSALYKDAQLYIYAASGIVPGSQAEQEWEEIENKQKNILCVFEELA
ncbi:MAG: isochorismate synthase [Myxococcales bacterium]|nr:isochorismate synthase [Myxococcales bacterium]USN51527.1 MAG: isochorismate synthase [Myxococcales bacterium]